jgi:hypothetical protein
MPVGDFHAKWYYWFVPVATAKDSDLYVTQFDNPWWKRQDC